MSTDVSSAQALPFPDAAVFGFDGAGGARALDVDEIDSDTDAYAFVWVHLRRGAPGTDELLHRICLDAFVESALVEEETRPRCTIHGDGALLILRGVNLNPGAEPEDMVSIRLWIEDRRIVSVGRRPLFGVADVMEGISRRQGPSRPGDLVARLALRLADRTEPVVAALNERVDDLEEAVLEQALSISRKELADIRRVAIVLRRYMIPQRDALTTFEIEDLAWLDQSDRSRLREASERVTRLGEELDAIRDRAQVVHDQIMDNRAEIMNRQMLVLSVVAAVFLPLGLVTGLLGINVGGIPLASDPWGFWVVCGLLVVIGGFQIWLFRRMGLIGSKR
jgi:zinc transporter